MKYLESKSIEEVEQLLKQLEEEYGNEERKKRKEQKQKEWLEIRQEVNSLVQDINFDQPMEEENKRDESMEISEAEDSSLDNSQENTPEQLEDVSPIVNFSILLLMMYKKYRESKSMIEEKNTPIIQPFDCGEKKSPYQDEETMDSIEEIPVFDVGASYLCDEEFDQLYPKHPIDVSYMFYITVTP